ncbi:hypothetical protein HK104_007543, partial [Borealophlyctis nickersoniae]
MSLRSNFPSETTLGFQPTVKPNNLSTSSSPSLKARPVSRRRAASAAASLGALKTNGLVEKYGMRTTTLHADFGSENTLVSPDEFPTSPVDSWDGDEGFEGEDVVDTATDETPDLVGRGGAASTISSGLLSEEGGDDLGGARRVKSRREKASVSWSADVARGARESALDERHDVHNLVSDLVALNHDLARANIRYGNLNSRMIELKYSIKRAISRLEDMDANFLEMLEELRVLRFERQFLSETLGLLLTRPDRRALRAQGTRSIKLLDDDEEHVSEREKILEYIQALSEGPLLTSTTPEQTTELPPP